jgi:hypothetical protein
MKSIAKLLIILFIAGFISGCEVKAPQKYNAGNNLLTYSGRIDKISSNEVVLIGSAASVSMLFTGDTCVVYLKNNTPNKLHNFISIELDGEDLGRTMLEGDSMIAMPVEIAFKLDKHKLSIYKSTEAANGNVIFGGVLCQQLVEQQGLPEKRIEFIGNSITCGMGNDTLDIPCHTDLWYDQHNAYWAYGSIVARALKINYMLSSVSGIGIYRNWNVEDGPTMPMVYENRYLNTDGSKKWDFSSFTPNVVSICLGTNDLSDGDGIHVRHPFDATIFTSKYIKFLETIYSHYPETQIALLGSPMITGEKDSILIKCLTNVKNHFEGTNHKPITIFQFDGITPHGCDSHPDIEDHMQMAEQLIPFYQQLLGELED